MLALLQLVAFFNIGWRALFGIPILIAGFFLFLRVNAWVYRRTLRPRLVRLIEARRVLPNLLVAHINDTKQHDELDGFKSDIETDFALHALAWLLCADLQGTEPD